VARAAVPGRLTWRAAVLAGARWETGTARTLVLRVPGWPGHLAGQHVDVRLTAEDGYTARRSYSLAAPADGELVELTVQRVDDGEVSPYLTDVLPVEASIEVRGPVGGWFVWRPESTRPVLLVAGGSGIVPLMAMVRARRQAGARTPFRLIYSVRTPEQAYYAPELRRARGDGLDVAYVYTRTAAEGAVRPAGRITAADLVRDGWPADFEPDCYVCGPTGFVETVSDLLTGLGHDPASIRTERFGPTGG
jgi:ferredoxin-NADP reductase